ncbi:hydrogen peroxide-inducible genes activator [Mangrovicoccus algicola]|uniref:Hydrogen peroxide-inducible genes activator n=1 Tax=Mangrovicoccus algicola TaxID=2771008 RepID=A0A8J6Z2C1_9RHOB|nr:hydrogen peroxide-inducible genes activator [Mangrovicoccus algicola]MBE3640356.1 hydrogen peroxide-inducible genes activator [Mangrovicoccus algicola]
MAHVTLKQLSYFEALARTGHFGRAAALCHVTQPALSMQIAELESQLGVTLVERRPRGVTLTAPGQEVARRAGDIGQAVRDLVEAAGLHSGGLAGPLRLGVIPTVAPYLLPALLQEVAVRFPASELKLRETVTQTLLSELAQGTLDLVIAALPLVHPEIETLPVFSERFMLIAPPGTQPQVSDEQVLARHPLLLLEEGHCFRDHALAACGLSVADEVDTLAASSLSTLVEMVAHGLGVTLIPEMAATSEARHDRVTVRSFAGPQRTRTVALAWRRSSPRGAEYRELAGILSGLAAQLSAPGDLP